MPEIIKPFVPTSELLERRKKVADLMLPGSLFVILGNELVARNADVEYSFRQDSSFWYLTGLNKPNSALVIYKGYDNRIATNLFIQDRDLDEEMWLGARLSPDEAAKITGIVNVDWFSDLVGSISKKYSAFSTVYFDLQGSYSSVRSSLTNYFSTQGRRSAADKILSITRATSILEKVRQVKSDWEITQMQIASDINIQAHKFARQNLENHFKISSTELYTEKDFEADLYYQYNKNGLTWSYPAIVASGNRGCILHYGDNNEIIDKDNLLLVDAGCEYNYYASDITRCYHPSGNWSEPQKEIYNLVLETNKKLIEYLATGKASYSSYHKLSVELLSKGLLDLQLLSGSLESVIETQSYKKFYMHGVGHWIGLDVHDLSVYLDDSGQRIDTPLQKNMTVTVEPGLYFHPEDDSIPQRYRGIAVRVEDDIVITESGVLNLTQDLEK